MNKSWYERPLVKIALWLLLAVATWIVVYFLIPMLV